MASKKIEGKGRDLRSPEVVIAPLDFKGTVYYCI